MVLQKKDDKKKNSPALFKKFQQRITVARNGRDLFQKGDYLNSVKKYNEYLNILAEINERDIYTLTPELFNSKKDITEMLLISHVYWDMAKVYEKSGKLHDSFYKCIQQFVLFTVNQPYQVLNAEMLRKFIKKNKGKLNYAEAFQKAHQKIYVESKKCFVATLCFGEEHQVTHDLRIFKVWLLNRNWGRLFVENYYRFAPSLVQKSENSLMLKSIFLLSKPIIYILNSIQKKLLKL